MLSNIFKKRRILIITDDNITNLPLSGKSQLVICFSVLFFISWVSFSSGKYFTFQQVIMKKESEVQQVNLINLDLQTKIDSLQSNLVRLNEYFNTVKEFDYNKPQSKRKKNDKEISLNNLPKTKDPFKKYNFDKRVSYNKKNNAVNDVNSQIIERISDIKNIIAMTGLSVSDVEDYNFDTNEQLNLTDNFSFKNQGGPDTTNSSTPQYLEANIDDKLHVSENIEQLLYLENLFNAVPFASPMKRYYISSSYGMRIDPMTRRKAQHYGIDLAGPIGAKIYSTAPGIVKFAGRKGNYGNFIEIDHGFNIVTRYGHLKKLLVKKGQKIDRDQLIALQGSSGRSSGPHLHYEIRFNDKHYNPKQFIKAGSYVF